CVTGYQQLQDTKLWQLCCARSSHSACSVKVAPDQQHIVGLFLVTTPGLPVAVKDFHHFFHRFGVYLSSRLPNSERAGLPAFGPPELSGESVGTEEYRIPFIQLDLVVREVRLILEYPAANREFVAFDLFHFSAPDNVQRPVCAGVFHLS